MYISSMVPAGRTQGEFPSHVLGKGKCHPLVLAYSSGGTGAYKIIVRGPFARHTQVMKSVNKRGLLLLPILLSAPGCVVVGGYSSTGGWFFWPGGLVISVLL